jgi:hypothetical protein
MLGWWPRKTRLQAESQGGVTNSAVAAFQFAVMPPSITNSLPVTQDASSEAR